MELLEAIIQNEHIVEYVCVTVFTLVGLASYTYLVYRNSIKDVKPDTEVDDDLESNIGSIYVDSDEVIDKGKGKMVDRGVDVLSQKLTDDVNQTEIPLKINLFNGSDYKEKLRLIYGDEIVKFSENRLGRNASRSALVNEVILNNKFKNVLDRPELIRIKPKYLGFVEGSSKDNLSHVLRFKPAIPLSSVEGYQSGGRYLEGSGKFHLSYGGRLSSPESTVVSGLITPVSRTSTPDSVSSMLSSTSTTISTHAPRLSLNKPEVNWGAMFFPTPTLNVDTPEGKIGGIFGGVLNYDKGSPVVKPEAPSVDRVVSSITRSNSTGIENTGNSNVDINVTDGVDISDIIF